MISPPIKVLIADDHPVFCDSMTYLLGSTDSIEVVGTANNGKEAIDFVTKKPMDVILMDIRMPVVDGIEATDIISKKHPKIKVLALTAIEREESIVKIFKHGAMGCLSKSCQIDDVIKAIKTVYENKVYYLGDVYDSLDDICFNNPLKLLISEREQEILRLLALGLSTSEIAESISISPNTVKKHRSNIMQKLEIKTTVELVRFAVEKFSD